VGVRVVVGIGVAVGVEVIVAVKVMAGVGEAVGIASLKGVGEGRGLWVGVLCSARVEDGKGEGDAKKEICPLHPLSIMIMAMDSQVINFVRWINPIRIRPVISQASKDRLIVEISLSPRQPLMWANIRPGPPSIGGHEQARGRDALKCFAIRGYRLPGG